MWIKGWQILCRELWVIFTLNFSLLGLGWDWVIPRYAQGILMVGIGGPCGEQTQAGCKGNVLQSLWSLDITAYGWLLLSKGDHSCHFPMHSIKPKCTSKQAELSGIQAGAKAKSCSPYWSMRERVAILTSELLGHRSGGAPTSWPSWGKSGFWNSLGILGARPEGLDRGRLWRWGPLLRHLYFCSRLMRGKWE